MFAVATAECFLVEWVRDAVLRDVQQTECYFQSRPRQGIRERWKDIIKDLHKSKRIPGLPDFGSSPAWSEFVVLVETRNALVHGNYSIPHQAAAAPTTQALSPDELLRRPIGWASDAVVAVIAELCSATVTQVPAWAM